MKVFFRISTRIFHILDQNSLLFCQENVRSEQLCHSKIFLLKILEVVHILYLVLSIILILLNLTKEHLLRIYLNTINI